MNPLQVTFNLTLGVDNTSWKDRIPNTSYVIEETEEEKKGEMGELYQDDEVEAENQDQNEGEDLEEQTDEQNVISERE
jgi:hypothetical protein